VTVLNDILTAAGWADDDRIPWIFEADDDPGFAFDEVRFVSIRRGKALAIAIGFNNDGPALLIRAFDGGQPAVVGSSSYEGAFLSVVVAEPMEDDI
jgi:hypothetical protein